MVDFTPPSFSVASDNPLFSAASSSSSSAAAAAVDDAFEDACSICLDPFSNQNPSTVTSCNHEYHLQCILEWSQRSKECPICWQLFSLKDPASQELLAAIETEKRLRTRNTSPAAFSNTPHFHEGFDVEQDSCSDDSDFDERIMQHIAIAASRARYIRRREKQRSSGHGPSQVFVFASPVNTHEVEHPTGDNAPSSNMVLPVENLPHLPSVVPPMANVLSSTAGDVPFKPRIVFRKPTSDSSLSPSSSEVLSFSDSIKSKWLAASARYKESISKGTKGIKEKLLARNSSVKELSKGVQREMSAGIAGVARMIERLDLSSKQTGPSSPASGFVGETNLSSKGKGVEVNFIQEDLDPRNEEVANATVLTASSHISNASSARLEVSEGGH